MAFSSLAALFAAFSLFAGGATASTGGPISAEAELSVAPLAAEVQEFRRRFSKELAERRSSQDEWTVSAAAPLPGEVAEVVLRLAYAVLCKGDAHYVAGRVSYQGRTLRTILYEGTEVTEVSLGRSPEVPTPVRIEIQRRNDCWLQNFEASLEHVRTDARLRPDQQDLDLLAVQHSPFIASRADLVELLERPEAIAQESDPRRRRRQDLPMALAYHVRQEPDGHMTLVYTVFFTDSDVQPRAPTPELRMARKGVSPEIQWIYEVTLDRSGNALRRAFHGPAGSGVAFPAIHLVNRETYLKGSMHPILQIGANVTGLQLEAGVPTPTALDGFHLVPRTVRPDRFRGHADRKPYRVSVNRLIYPLAREWLLFRMPWMFRMADLELREEGKLPAAELTSADYLYVMAYGHLKSGRLRAVIDVGPPGGKSQRFHSAPAGDGIAVLGEGMWGQQSTLALPVGRELLARLQSGELQGSLRLETSGKEQGFRIIEPPRILMLRENGRSYVSFLTEPELELTRRLSCARDAAGALECLLAATPPTMR